MTAGVTAGQYNLKLDFSFPSPGTQQVLQSSALCGVYLWHQVNTGLLPCQLHNT